MTINQLFHETVNACSAKTALRYKEKKAYRDITYGELAQQVERLASALAALGVEKGDRIALLSENRPEWATVDLAALALGAIVVPIYPTLPAPQVAYIVHNSDAKILFVEDGKQLKKAQDSRDALPDIQRIIVMEEGKEPIPSDPAAPAIVQSLSSLMELGENAPLGREAYAARWQSVQPDDIASLVYTSGTTGDPKGTMLTHGNFVASVDASLAHYRNDGEPVTANDTFLSFLPLSHTYERTTGYYLPMRVGATIAYAEGLRTLAEDMVLAQPTLMVCVPRLWDSMRERTEDAVAKMPARRQSIFRAALDVGAAYAARRNAGKSPGPILALKRLVFEKLVYGKLRARFGGNFRFFVSGGAALSVDTSHFFQAIGIPISEGYGMTEASPVISINPVRRWREGTVGTVVPGGTMRIAGDGEVLYRGPNVMKGYWLNETATHEMIDSEGWLHTGDIGVIDSDGYLKITDRKKDIIVLANGKNVAPQPIEQTIKQSPFIQEIVLIGDKQSVVTALVLPNKAKLGEWAKAQGLTFSDDDALIALPEAKKKIKQEIDARSTALADFEKIKKFTLLNATFGIESGELTPTLKIKRKVVLQNYAAEIAAMRGGDGTTES